MKKFFGEFKTFITRGNVVDLAIGVIIGGAFSAITTALVDSVVMPVINMLIGGIDFQTWEIALPTLYKNAEPVIMRPGLFINAIVNFVIIALVLFSIVKAMNSLRRKKDEAPEEPPAPPEPTKEELLLTEIRDLLKDR